MWLLSEHECDLAYDGCQHDAYLQHVAKAQLRKVIEEGEKPCPHGEPVGYIGEHPIVKNIKKHQCPECRQEMKKEAGI